MLCVLRIWRPTVDDHADNRWLLSPRDKSRAYPFPKNAKFGRETAWQWFCENSMSFTKYSHRSPWTESSENMNILYLYTKMSVRVKTVHKKCNEKYMLICFPPLFTRRILCRPDSDINRGRQCTQYLVSPVSPLHAYLNPSFCSPLYPSITPSLFHSKLKTYLFGKSFHP